MTPRKAKRRFKRRFDEELYRCIGQKPKRRRWELLASSDRPVRPSWEHFSHGSDLQVAITPVEIKGRIYWAVARASGDENFLGKFFLLGPFALLAYKETITVAFWEDDPRTLEYPIDHYHRGWPKDPNEPKRHFITSPERVEQL